MSFVVRLILIFLVIVRFFVKTREKARKQEKNEEKKIEINTLKSLFYPFTTKKNIDFKKFVLILKIGKYT